MENISRAKILVKNTGWVYLGKVVTQMFSILATILVIRKLHVDIYGTFNFLLSIMVLYHVFAISPIQNVFNRYIPELIQKGDFIKFKKIIKVGIITSTGAVVLISLLLYIFNRPFSQFFNIPGLKNYFFALSFFIFFTFLRTLLNSILTSSLLHRIAALLNIFSSFIRSALLIILIRSIDVNLLLEIEAITALIFFLPGIVLLIRYFNKKIENHIINQIEPVTRKRVMKFGMYSAFNELGAGIVGRTSDFYIISALSNLYNVGLYSFGNKIYEIIFKVLPVQEFLTVLRPVFFQKFTERFEREEFIQVYNLIVKIMLPVFVLPAFYFILFGKPLILLVIDPKYIQAYWVTSIILLSNITLAIFFPLSLVLHLKERMDIALLSKIVVIFSIGAGIIFMKFFGIIGVATATLLGDFLKNIFILLLLRKHVPISYRLRECKNYLFIFLAIGIPFYFIQYLISSAWTLLFISLIYLLINFLLIVVFHPFTNRDLYSLEKLSQSTRLTRKMKQPLVKIYGLRSILIKLSKRNAEES